MRFLIFIKQVPTSSEIRFDSHTKTLVRDGVKNEMNAYDRRAITEAIRYRTEKGGEVIAATMGPSSAKDALREALIMGVDSAIHILDPRLAGSDTLVTSRVLAAAAKRIGYDVIFCGQHSTDSETGQVPVELAELLGLPCATAVRKIEYLPEGVLHVSSETEEGSLLLEMPLPAVISTAERLIRPLKTKNADLSKAPDGKIQELNLGDLGMSASEAGLAGSPTWVSEICDVRITRAPDLWDGTDSAGTAAKLLDLIRHRKSRVQQISRVPQKSRNSDDAREYWCWIEFLQNQIRPVSLEILSCGANLAAEKGGKVCALLAGHLNPQISALLGSYGADKIYYVQTTQPHPDEIVSLLSDRVVLQKPFALLFPATSQGKYLAPRIAARLGLGLTGDCVGLTFQGDEKLAQLKPAFGGNIVAPIFTRTSPILTTIRSGALETRGPRTPFEPEVDHWNLPENVVKQFTIIAQEIDPGVEAVKMDHSKVVVGVGMGVGLENLQLAFHLAGLLDGAVGATRRVVDSGWVARQFQIGLTGKFIAPEVYLGLGVSGRYNHMIGVQKSGLIIGINQDPSAEIFQTADIGVNGDCVAIAAEMILLIEKE
ncbi:FAD-binding protein [bacterium]|nr:FAD-binding protein [bacterium]